jgi:hypothetical protein
MSHAESPQITTLNFFPLWEHQGEPRLVAELISVSKETHREPDTYHFEVNNGILIDPETRKPVLSFVARNIEYQIAERLQSWASENDEGLAYWISPRSREYPCEKIIIHRIAYTWDAKKVVQNCAILFDGELGNPEDLRKTLFMVEDKEETLLGILTWLGKVTTKKVECGNGRGDFKEKAVHLAKRILKGESRYSIVNEMQKSGFLGNNPISCRRSFSDLTVSRSSLSYEYHQGTCCLCHKKNEVGPCNICKDCEKQFKKTSE